MANLDINSFVCIPLRTKLYVEIINRYPDTAGSLIEDVLIDFLDRTDSDIHPEGFIWNQLFLPNGTQLRTKYLGEYKVAEIVGDKIIWHNKNYPSVSNLANEMRNNTSNNAWKVMEIKLPNNREWQLADRLR